MVIGGDLTWCGGEHTIQAALAGVAQWIECGPGNQRVTGLIPSQGTCLGCRLGTQLRGE